MKIKKELFTFLPYFTFCFFIISCSSTPKKQFPDFKINPERLVGTKLETTQAKLKLKDLDKMQRIVHRFVIKAEELNQSKPLKRAMRIILSRPNEDAMIGKLLPQIISYLLDWKELNTTITSLTEEALHRVKAHHGPISHQITYIILLENLVYELNSQKEQWAFAKKLLLRIYQSDIKLSKKIKNSLQMQTMKRLVSPSRLAKAALS